jgi:tetratricopeptide (TPR) repeat protein
MVGNEYRHHLFIEEQPASTQENRLSIPYLSSGEERIFTMLELKETALAAYEQAIQLAPYEATLHYHKGQLLEQLGRSHEAATAYDEANRLGYQRQTEARACSHASSALANTKQGHA